MVQLERHLHQPAAERFEIVQTTGHMTSERLVGIEAARGGPLVDGEAVHVAEGGWGFHVEEPGVEAGQLLHGQSFRLVLACASGFACRFSRFTAVS